MRGLCSALCKIMSQPDAFWRMNCTSVGWIPCRNMLKRNLTWNIQHTSGGYSKYRGGLRTSFLLHPGFCTTAAPSLGSTENWATPLTVWSTWSMWSLTTAHICWACIPTSPMAQSTLRLNSPKWLLRWVGIERWESWNSLEKNAEKRVIWRS
jgi:hypothetical protein